MRYQPRQANSFNLQREKKNKTTTNFVSGFSQESRLPPVRARGRVNVHRHGRRTAPERQRFRNVSGVGGGQRHSQPGLMAGDEPNWYLFETLVERQHKQFERQRHVRGAPRDAPTRAKCQGIVGAEHQFRDLGTSSLEAHLMSGTRNPTNGISRHTLVARPALGNGGSDISCTSLSSSLILEPRGEKFCRSSGEAGVGRLELRRVA